MIDTMTAVPRPLLLLPLSAAVAVLLTACGAASASSPPAAVPASSTTAAPPASASATPPVSSAPPVTPTSPTAPTSPRATVAPAPAPRVLAPPAGLDWRRVTSSSAVRVATVDGGAISLLWLDQTRLRFHYVPGYEIPGGPSSSLDTAVSTWLPRMVAAFNGGFKLSDGAGGYYYRGHTVATLIGGRAAFAIAKDGSLKVGVWGRDLRMSSSWVVVRQNLRPLVDQGVSMAGPGDYASRWGNADKGSSTANRTALGMRRDGSVVFAYGADVTAYALARGLVRAGVREAVVLDMNRTWPTGFTYAHHGGSVTGRPINPAVMRPPSTYYARFKKDFVAVLVR
jgi:hypothetical protein